MPKSPPHPISTPIPELQGIASVASGAPIRITYNPAYQVTYEGADPTRGYVYVREDAAPPELIERARWRERWYGSEPQRGSSIVTERGNLVAYFGGDEQTHKIVRQVVAAHNAAVTALAYGPQQ